jgi:hypothetical protein
MNYPIRILGSLYFLFFTLNIANAQIQRVVSGDILSVNTQTKFTLEDQVKLGQTKTIVLSKGTGHHIIAGIDLNTIPGQYLLTVHSKKLQLESINYIVTATQQQFLNIAPRFNSLSNSEKVKESLLWSNREPKLPLIFPAEGNWNKSFGQYYESSESNLLESGFTQNITSQNKNKLKKLHRIDHISLNFNKPLDVVSPSDAICFLINFDEENGYTVLLDHGMGLFSEISGLDNLTISEQDKVKKGSLIGNFTKENLVNKKNTTSLISKTIQWRVFLTKSIINPTSLTKPL